MSMAGFRTSLSLAKATLFAALIVLSASATAPAKSKLVFEIDRTEKRLYVQHNGTRIGAHDVSVGKDDHPTPLGSWKIYQVDINPDWQPPDSEWAEDSEYKPPGHPDNPMGRIRMIFDPPYTIHGTDDEESLGKAESHGSIRVANDVAIELAELLLREGRVWQGQEWFEAMLDSPEEMFEIELEEPVPIEIVE